MLTSREKYIERTFFSDLPSDESIELVKKISEVGDSLGFIGTNVSQDQEKSSKRKHKYDVWIAKEVKKDIETINKTIELRLIVDWAVDTSVDIFKLDFNQAFEQQAEWHDEMRRKYQIENMNLPELDGTRVIFRFSDRNHFLYLLNADDLKHEGSLMGNCVGGNNYKSKVRNKQSLILSIRDKDNMPHTTIEVDVNSRKVIQKYGKGNKAPVKKYLEMYAEYALFATDFKNIRNKEVLKFLNLGFICTQQENPPITKCEWDELPQSSLIYTNLYKKFYKN